MDDSPKVGEQFSLFYRLSGIAKSNLGKRITFYQILMLLTFFILITDERMILRIDFF